MKKFVSLMAVCLLSLCMLAGCGDKTFELSKIKTDKYVSTLAQYKGLTVEAEPKTELDDYYYNYFAEYMFAEFVQNAVPADYVAAKGDTLILDYEGKIDGVAFDGGTAQGTYLTLGSGTFIAGFEDSLIGVKAGETRDITVTFPDPYTPNEELSGKPAVFTCTIHSIVPAYNEESIALISNPNFSNVEEYEAYVKEYVDNMINSSYRETVVGAALEQIEGATVVKSIPEELMTEQRAAVIKSYEASATQYAMSVDDLLKQYGTSVDEQTEKYAKRTLICQAIANIENITVTDEEIETGALDFVNDSTGFETVEAFFAEYGREYFKNYLMSQKVYDLIMENTTVVAPATEETTDSE